MADDKSKRGPQDRKVISLEEEYEVAYWTGKFGVTKDRLVAAVKSAGHSAAAVEEYLPKRAKENDESVRAAAKMPSP